MLTKHGRFLIAGILSTFLAQTAWALAPVKLAAADAHTCALFDDGSVKCWGDNGSGQLGTETSSGFGGAVGTMGEKLPFIRLSRKAIDIKANGLFSCALLDDRSIKCWGENGAGALGQEDQVSRGNKAGTMGDGLKPINLGAGRKVMSFAMGYDHVCAILDNAELKCWGNNSSGQLGLGDTNGRGDAKDEMGDKLPAVKLGLGRKAVQVSAGYTHTCALLDNGAVKCWGDNSNGQLGQGDGNSRGTNATDMGDVLKPVNLGQTPKAAEVFAASTHSCVIFADRSIKCWGDNSNGATGAGDPGSFGDGDGEMGEALKFLELEAGLTVEQFSCARRHCCVSFAGPGTLKCWGANTNGQLGLGDAIDRGNAPGQLGQSLPFVDLGQFEAVKSIATSRYHSCVLLADSGVKCWGLNGSGQLGLGDTRDRGLLARDMGDALLRARLY